MKKVLQLGLVVGMALLCATAMANPNMLVNPGAETGDLTGWDPVLTSAGVDNGTFDAYINPRTGLYDFVGRTGGTATLVQRVSLLGNGYTSGQIDGGGLTALVSFWEQSLDQATDPAGPNPPSPVLNDEAYVKLAFLDGTLSVLSSVSTPGLNQTGYTWANFTGMYNIPVGTRYIDYSMEFVRHKGWDLDAFIDDNSLTVPDKSSFGWVALLVFALAGSLPIWKKIA